MPTATILPMRSARRLEAIGKHLLFEAFARIGILAAPDLLYEEVKRLLRGHAVSAQEYETIMRTVAAELEI